jgi:hypothetical protein
MTSYSSSDATEAAALFAAAAAAGGVGVGEEEGEEEAAAGEGGDGAKESEGEEEEGAAKRTEGITGNVQGPGRRRREGVRARARMGWEWDGRRGGGERTKRGGEMRRRDVRRVVKEKVIRKIGVYISV